MLLRNIDYAHMNFALHAQQGADGRQRNAMLAGSSLGHHFFLAHLLGQQHLADAVVDFMGAGMIQILALEINLCATRGRQVARMIHRAWTANVSTVQAVHFSNEFRVLDDLAICMPNIGHDAAQAVILDRSAVNAEKAVVVWCDEGRQC